MPQATFISLLFLLFIGFSSLTAIAQEGAGEISDVSTKEETKSSDYGRHLVSFQPSDLVVQNLTFSYEYFISNILSVKVPFTYGYGNSYLEYNSYHQVNFPLVSGGSKVFGTGLSLNYYPTGQGKVRYFIAPSAFYSKLRYKYYSYDYDGNTKGVYLRYSGPLDVSSIQLVQGLLIQAGKPLSLSGWFGVGAKWTKYERSKRWGNAQGIGLSLGVSLGYRFGYR